MIPRQMPYLRLGFSVAALLSPKVATTVFGGRPSQVTPVAKAWAAIFATREAALGAITLESDRLDPATRRKALLLNAAIDGIDTLSFLALVRRQRSLFPLLLVVPAGVVSVVAHVQAARELDGTSGAGSTQFENAYATA